MKGLFQSTILVVSLSTLSFSSSSATDTQSAKNGPRCDPYPDCQLTINKHDQDSQNTLSEIYRFDKMLTKIG